MFDELHTKRLDLRFLGELDADEFFAVVDADRKALGQWLPWVEEHCTIEHSEAFLAAAEIQLDMENGGICGIFMQQELIGCITIHWIQNDNYSASLGYWLASSAQRKGFAQEACETVLQYCFEGLALNRIELSVACENTPSTRLAERLGFHSEGIRREYEHLHGRFWDHHAYSLLRSDSDASWTRK